MLCSICGTKVQVVGDRIVCKTCDSEFNIFDSDEELVPEPRFVSIQLGIQYAIVEARKQVIYAILDSRKKSERITFLLNKNLAETELKKEISKKQ
jgi:hypothetical protein